MVESQRWRLLVAAAEVLAEHGYAGTTSRLVARRASVSPSTFYAHFDDVEACLLASHQMTSDCIWELIAAACTGPGDWIQRLHSAADVALDFLGTEPNLAHLLGPDLASGVAAVAAARERLLERVAGLLCCGRRLRRQSAAELAPDIELRLIAGAVALLGERVLSREYDALPGLAPELATILAAPYRQSAGE
jgi:AcrR family transcriptional regulator